MRAWVCYWNGLFNRLVKSTGHRSAQIITDKLCIFNENWHRTSAVVTFERQTSIMSQNPLTTWACEVTWPIKNNISSSAKPTARKFGRVVVYDEGNSPMMPPSDDVVTWSHVANWKLNISSSKTSTITKLCRVVINKEGNSPIVSYNSLTTKSGEVMWQTKKQNFFSCTTPVTTKLGRMETYNAGNLPIISHDPATLYSHQVTWQIKNKISPCPQGR